MDDLDLGIFRWMFPGGVLSPDGVDPRITTSDIARHVGLRRKAVWARIRAWKRSGLWLGLTARPNPALFGMRMFQAEIPVTDPAAGWDLMDKLGPVDGAMGVGLAFGDSEHARNEEVVQLRFAATTMSDVRRTMRVLKRAAPAGEVYGPYKVDPPPCELVLRRLDWRILAAIVANPSASPSRLAHVVGVTVKTVTSRRAALIDSHAVWYLPDLDWSKHPSVAFAVYCRHSEDRERVRRSLDARFRHYVPISTRALEFPAPDYDEGTCLAILVPAHAPAETDALVLELARIPGVRLVRPTVWGPGRRFPHWADRLIAARLDSSEPNQGRRSIGRSHGSARDRPSPSLRATGRRRRSP